MKIIFRANGTLEVENHPCLDSRILATIVSWNHGAVRTRFRASFVHMGNTEDRDVGGGGGQSLGLGLEPGKNTDFK